MLEENVKNITDKRKFLIDRLGYLRNRAKLSARELSLRTGKSIAYFAKFDNGDFSIPAEVLMEAVENCNSNMQEFFWQDISKYNEQKDLLEKFEKLSDESKQNILNLLKNMK